MMADTLVAERWRVADVAALPQQAGTRYELIEGVLLVSKQPHWHHQATCDNIIYELMRWSRESGAGRPLQAPGIVYADDEAVAPDVVWIRRERLDALLAADGKLHASPDIVIEVLSDGSEQRDRSAKLHLYARHGVPEYWLVDWRAQRIEIYRHQQGALRLAQTLHRGDTLRSPLLPGFACTIDQFFSL